MPTPQTSKHVVLLVVISLAVFAMTALAGAIWLIHDKTDPALIGIVATQGTTALGALAAVLVSTKAGDVPAPAPVVDPIEAAMAAVPQVVAK